ncbi:hypothetical protein C5167_048310 [Papaver somniferum]|uniref:Uncharacterized protein n=1 Tax=Papaver somniferum TaxID=3469 RepID=A0A4Y7KLK3_PAPSO|nr:hypothetical protein C5167_048310 [Papaver somniferum]
MDLERMDLHKKGVSDVPEFCFVTSLICTRTGIIYELACLKKRVRSTGIPRLSAFAGFKLSGWYLLRRIVEP